MAVTRDGLLGEVRSLAIYIQHEGPFSFSFSREGLREHSQPSLTTGIKMKATDVTQNSLGVSKSALAAENPILGTWKLQSMVYEATATGERSSPFGDHPDGYLSYSADGRMYAIGVVEDRPKPCDPVPRRIQSECKHPERCVTGHPFNPPHLIPLVEVVGGAKTSAETIERAMRFY